jgi:hypothetical protein
MELGSRGSQGVREHYNVARMAESAVAVYQSVLSGRIQHEGPMIPEEKCLKS